MESRHDGRKPMSKGLRYWLKAFWHFIWEDESPWSWLANIALAFILIKFIVYPGMGLVFGTGYPVVAVMSSSMEHSGPFDSWWENDTALCEPGSYCRQKDFYSGYGIKREDFMKFSFSNGFNTGDIMVIFGKSPESINVGDVVVYWANGPIPIIHRVIAKTAESGQIFFKTKGDNNPGLNYNEARIESKLIVGKAVLRIPYLGWIKIGFTKLLAKIGF